jgi:hypothetical protein
LNEARALQRLLSMVRLVPPAALAICISLFSVPEARADGYISLGIGDSSLGGELDQRFAGADSSAMRLSLGQRFGNFAVEASLFGSDFNGDSMAIGTGGEGTLSLGVDLKYYFFHTGPLELYGRGGLNKTWLRAAGAAGEGHSGTGWDAGIGAQLGFDLPFASMGLWAELNHHQTDLRDPGQPDLDGHIQTAMLGLAVGL